MPTINEAARALRNFQPSGGVAFSEIANKAADNDICKVSFFENGKPKLTVEQSPVEDPEPRAKIADVAAGLSLTDFGAKVDELIANGSDVRKYLEPAWDRDAFKTHAKHNAVTQGRIAQFVKELRGYAAANFSGADRSTAMAFANKAAFEMKMRRTVFDNIQTNGYWSFGHDAAFIHGKEKKLESLKKIDFAKMESTGAMTGAEIAEVKKEMGQLQNWLDAIFAGKYVYHNSSMNEMDAESSMELAIIDRDSRARVSEQKSTLKTVVPKFEVLSVQEGGEKKFVYWDAKQDKYFYDGTGTEVPANVLGTAGDAGSHPANVRSQSVRETTARRLNTADGERVRDGFRYNWNNDQYVSDIIISWVGWAGHCDIKAIMEAWGLVVPQDHGGSTNYDARSGETIQWTPDLLNEEVASMLETSNTQRSKFGAHRTDDEPDRADLGTRYKLPLDNRPNEFKVTSVTVPLDGETKTLSASDVFREKLINDIDTPNGDPVRDNPLYNAGASQADRVAVNLGEAEKFDVSSKVRVFNEHGRIVEKRSSFTVDWSDANAEPQLVDSHIEDPSARIIWEIRLDSANKKQLFEKFQWVDDGNGNFEKKSLDKFEESFDPKRMVVSHETSLDSIESFLPFLEDAVAEARNITFETALDGGVWNGAGVSLELTDNDGWIHFTPEGKQDWALISVDVDARYGNNAGQVLIKFDDQGNIDMKNSVPVKAPFDFIWMIFPSFDPTSGREGKALERGIIENGGRDAQAVENACKMLQAAWHGMDSITLPNGAVQVYERSQRDAFEADKNTLDALRQAVMGDGGGTTPPPTQRAELLKISSDEVKKNEVDNFSFEVMADGKVEVRLSTVEGDADLTVKGPDGFSKQSYNSGTEADVIEIPDAKAGQTYSIEVNGYAPESTYRLEVMGEKPTAPTSNDVNINETLELGHDQTHSFPSFPVDQATTLKIDMKAPDARAGNDMDVYVAFGRAPDMSSRDGYAMRLYASGSTESATVQVPAGAEVFIMAHGYGDQNVANIKVTEA
ncbi:MAG: PPC domain-containing protein [Deltaproteobacteria bacterium]